MPYHCFDAEPHDDYYDEDYAHYTPVIPPPPEPLTKLDSTHQTTIEGIAEPEPLTVPILRMLPAVKRVERVAETAPPPILTAAPSHCRSEKEYIAVAAQLAVDLDKFASEAAWRGTKRIAGDLHRIIQAVGLLKERRNYDAGRTKRRRRGLGQQSLFDAGIDAV